MKDEQELNICLVTLVEKNRCLYDPMNPNYCNRTAQDRAWEKIANDLSESPSICKERWRNLRGCYTRYLKSSSSGTKTKKPYYLVKYLRFLRPFTKTRKSTKHHTSYQSKQSPPELEMEEKHIVMDELENETDVGITEFEIVHVPNPYQSSVENFTTPDSKTFDASCNSHSALPATIPNVSKVPHEYFQPENVSTEHASTGERKHEDPDLSFLVSILPDMKEMNSNQKRRFKIGILSMAGQILEENRRTSSPTPSAYSSSSRSYCQP